MAFQTSVRDKVDSLSEVFSFKKTIEEKKQKAKTEIAEAFIEAERLLRSVRQEGWETRRDERMLKVGDAPIEMVITVDRDGKMISARVAAIDTNV